MMWPVLETIAILNTRRNTPPVDSLVMPRTHDYTKQSWGHATSGWNTKDGGMTASCCGWGRGIKIGDYILLKNGTADTRYQFEKISYFHDPSDMWSAKLKFVPRQA